MDTVSAFSALEVEKRLLQSNRKILLRGLVAGGLQSSTVARKCQRKLGCYRCNIVFVSNFVETLV